MLPPLTSGPTLPVVMVEAPAWKEAALALSVRLPPTVVALKATLLAFQVPVAPLEVTSMLPLVVERVDPAPGWKVNPEVIVKSPVVVEISEVPPVAMPEAAEVAVSVILPMPVLLILDAVEVEMVVPDKPKSPSTVVTSED